LPELEIESTTNERSAAMPHDREEQKLQEGSFDHFTIILGRIGFATLHAEIAP
jgi:hypothetical protein